MGLTEPEEKVCGYCNGHSFIGGEEDGYKTCKYCVNGTEKEKVCVWRFVGVSEFHEKIYEDCTEFIIGMPSNGVCAECGGRIVEEGK